MSKKIGIIGGSGLYDIEGLNGLKEKTITTPFGSPSGAYQIGELHGVEVVFLPRHGQGHKMSPSEINYRANIFGFKKLGVEDIISVSAVGSLKEHLHPMDMVIPNQFYDRTNHLRKSTFFEDGIVAHISFAHPICPILSRLLFETACDLGITVHNGGTYINIEGPAFSTKAESLVYRGWDMDIIGMTNLTEAKLAREAEICYAVLAMVTDYDCWHDTHDQVTLETVIEYLTKNIQNAKTILKSAISSLPDTADCDCKNALSGAIFTSPDKIDKKVRQRLNVILKKMKK